jgi:hypothetical protein
MWDFQHAFEVHPRLRDSIVKWIPAHKTFQEAVEGGMSFEDWSGNGMADCFAKWAAKEGGPPEELVLERAANRARNEMLLKTAGAVLLQRLKARPRTKDDAAVKARKRPEPGLPRRLRAAKKPRFVLQREEQAGPSLAELVHIGARVRCSADQARQLVWQAAEPEEGLHKLAAAGPWPNAGTLLGKNGRIFWQWQCARCQVRASDSSRAVALLKKVCKGDHGVTMEEAPHEWADTTVGPTCTRCKLVRGNGRSTETAGRVCPVMACRRAGEHWPEGEASLAKEMGKLYGFRRWCETPRIEVRTAGAAAEETPLEAVRAAGGRAPAEGLLAPWRPHLACKLGRKWLCLDCFAVEESGVAVFRRARCGGRVPAADASRAMLNAVVRYGPRAGLLGAGQARIAELWGVAGRPVSTFDSAGQPEHLKEPLGLSVIGRALLGGQSGGEADAQGTRGDRAGGLLRPRFGGVQVAEEGIKRRKVEGSQETPGPPGQGTGTVCAGSSVATQPGAQGPIRSSALGQSLLRAQGASGSGSMRGPVLAAGFAGAGSHLSASSPVLAVQRSALGEAAGAESRVRLKRSRKLDGPGPEPPCSPGALDARAACRGVEVASAVAAWPSGSRDQVGRGGSSSSGPSGPC